MEKIELLAPAKDLECGISAIKCGADAIYLGATRFGARSAAGNTMADIEKLINFAHKYFAKVYVTVNTILTNEEIKEAKKLIQKLYEMGADAIIIQDTGLLEIGLPPIPLIVSTQMHNNTVEKIKFLEAVGLKRVILARELSLDQIKEISSEVNIELECFLHGALCVCYSGQCYLSYAIGGRSGNRGECAQPCRKQYSLIDENGKAIAKGLYLLSLKDLNLSKYIEDLLKSGVTSFKIEGRLKGPDYIKNVITYYRQEIDSVLDKMDLQKASSGTVVADFSPDLYKTFNRGYTTYYLLDRTKDVASPHTPKSLGEPVGEVKTLSNDHIEIKTVKNLSSGDGICFFTRDNILTGTLINNVIENKLYLQNMDNLYKGAMIYRNEDIEFGKILKSSKIRREIAIIISITEENENIIIKALDEDGVEAVYKYHTTGEKAKDQAALIENYKKQLAKTGNTEFTASEIDIQLTEFYFISIKEMNDLRRNLLELLTMNRGITRSIERLSIKPNSYKYPQKELDFSGNVYNDYARKFYERHGVEKIEQAAETLKNMSGLKVMTTKHCLKYQYDACSKHQGSKKLKEPLYLVDELGKKYELRFNCSDCVMEIYF